MSGHFEVFTDRDSHIRYRLVSPSGTVLLESGSYPDKLAVAEAIAQVRECAGTGLIHDGDVNAGSLAASGTTRLSGRAGGRKHAGAVLTREGPRATTVASRVEHAELDLESEDIDELLSQLAAKAQAALGDQRPSVDCGISVHRAKRASSSASTGALCASLMELQGRFKEGPGPKALAESHAVVVPDLAQGGPWPRLRRAAQAQGIRSVVVVPLWAGEQGDAVLSACSGRPNEFSDDEILTLERFGAEISRRLRPALRVAALAETLQDLYAAIANRTPIDVAVGIVMAQNRCDQGAAMDIIRRASTSRNVKIRDLAGTIIAAVSGHEAVTAHFEP
ncbi:ANTAR domain-containing protein [Paenarthrobacter nitroguajacolicus]|uniref:ANTAR domain-containing protein n=1 Tax=Paenarthrobacter nitroguajacolicus TaxID=211146 RepID=UPI00285BACB2|nr:ANTAR domain-containing protein [Paenarthrobacter nitroguajacolicus]MDR6636888.1 uncharacterized protein YegP (UPF0339 family) [Paenarthrobacter nitroguajacolicus]